MLKTTLDDLPDNKQQNIRTIVDLIHDEFDQTVNAATKPEKVRSRILLIILFGSHAKGTYVDDPEHGYISDYDILVILNEPALAEDYKIWHTVEERAAVKIQAPVNLVVCTLREINRELEQGHYFFKDIREQGIQLYQYNHTELLSPGRLVREEMAQVAQQHFEHWFNSANNFFDLYQMAMDKRYLNEAAFQLHQAVERYFSCLLLVFTNYRPKSHNIKMLQSLATQLPLREPSGIKGIFPQNTKFARRCFQLLKKAYIEARYSEHYEITEEELVFLAEQVATLQQKAETLCKDKINHF